VNDHNMKVAVGAGMDVIAERDATIEKLRGILRQFVWLDDNQATASDDEFDEVRDAAFTNARLNA
jgi:hypothetical protein